jgi:hypothetical protein
MAPYHELLEVKWKTGDQDKFKFTSNAPITSDSGGVKIGLGDVTEYAQLVNHWHLYILKYRAETNTSSSTVQT